MEKSPQPPRRTIPIPSGPDLDSHDLPPSYTLTPESRLPPSLSLSLSQSSSSTPRLPLRSTPGLPPLPYTAYHIPHATLSPDKSTITVTDPSLTSDPIRLARFITAQAALPPRPQIRIVGVRDSVHERNKVDFDISINLLRHILRPGASPGGAGAGVSAWNHVKIDSDGAPDGLNGGNGTLETWTRQFVNDGAAKKSFALRREVVNWNTGLLEGRLRTMIAGLKYQGRVRIEFGATHRKVVVLCASNEKSTLYSRVLSLVQEPKAYEVVRSVWPYANVPVPEGEEDGVVSGRECAVQSEREWWEDWRVWIARAVVARHKGLLTLDDIMEGAMGPGGMGEVMVEKDWGGDD